MRTRACTVLVYASVSRWLHALKRLRVFNVVDSPWNSMKHRSLTWNRKYQRFNISVDVA